MWAKLQKPPLITIIGGWIINLAWAGTVLLILLLLAGIRSRFQK